MPTQNISIPIQYAYLKEEFLYQGDKTKNKLIPVCIHGISSFQGTAVGFHCMTNFGAHFSRLPIHAFQWKEEVENPQPLDFLQLWDCFGYEVSVCAFDYLKNLECEITLKDRTKMRGNYVFTIDWYWNDYSEEISQYKCGHFIKLQNGQYAIQPNNRVQWFDTNYITAPFPEQPDFKAFNTNYKCEIGGKWKVKDDEEFFYEFQ